ncbi:arylsulfatase B-like [Cylas formicarius]|uniref:arylsulfatase B-like n=1 Tax=Cylas formicarius TaxID=197179 RepID=UPI002958BCA9|nr:arylsulfatase B-like [Cylas formicarius]
MKPFVVLFVISWGIFTCLAGKQQQPHIVVILADDVGWNDFGYHGSNQIPTPNIDALGYNGVILNRFYTQQTCTPSRAALLTGNYPIRSGMQGYPMRCGENRYIPADMATLPQKLKELGYNTHLVGKWHLGAATSSVTPTGKGFDTHFGYYNGFVGYFDYVISQDMSAYNLSDYVGFDLHDSFKPQWALQGRYATELFTEKTIDIIDKHDQEAPLFLMLAHLAAHTGANGTELGVPNITETNEKYDYIENPMRKRYADVMNIMDKSVGEIVKKLNEKNMLENAVILFFSDNGAQTIGMYENYGSNWPLRGLKFSLHEGGVRGSGVLYSPLLSKKRYINNQLIHISDWLPTFYHIAGGNISDLGKLDGVNQWTTISEDQRGSRNEILVNIDEELNYSGLIGYKGRYKLLNGTFQGGIYDGYYGESGRDTSNPSYDLDMILESDVNKAIQSISNQRQLTKRRINYIREQLDISWCRNQQIPEDLVCSGFCLFDIRNDPCETRNIIDQHQKIAERLKKRLSEFYDNLVPQTNKPVDLASDPKLFNNTWCTWLEPELCSKAE